MSLERTFEQDRYNALRKEAEYNRLRGIRLKSSEQRLFDEELREAEVDAKEAQREANRPAD